MKKYLLLLLLLPTIAFGRKFYISSSGNDANSGLSSAAPWQTINKVKSFAYAGSAMAGDTFAFKCGDVFYTVNQWDGLNWRGGGFQGLNCASGTANAPIVFTSYGTGAKPNLLFPQPSTVSARSVLTFIRVSYIIVENLQFNDTRFNSSDKITPAYTLVGVKLGDWESSGDSSASFSNHCIVRNCDFNNVSLPIVYNGNYNKIYNNTMTNLPNAVVDGIGSYGANGVTATGSYDTIINNSITGAWAYSSYFGLNGGAIEFYNVNNYNFIAYNTFSDCGGIGEFGAGKANQTANYNTFAYNKIINCGDVSYANISGNFAIQAKNIRWWNNVIIENADSRFSGPNFGTGFTGFTTYPKPSNKFFSNNGSPIADTVWDLRNNVFWIVNKTVYNGVTYTYIVNNGVKTVHLNNIYRLTNNATPSYSLGASEIATSSKVFTDTSNINPLLWDYQLPEGSVAINTGINVGVSPDFGGTPVVGIPSIGIYQYGGPSPVQCTSWVYSPWTTCTNGKQTRSYTSIPSGCMGTPPTDSIVRNCAVVSLAVTSIKNSCCINSYDGSITVAATGGRVPYYYSINSTSKYVLNKTTFTRLKAGNYIIRVRDTNGNPASVTATISIIVK
jgi:hypothetical protein